MLFNITDDKKHNLRYHFDITYDKKHNLFKIMT